MTENLFEIISASGSRIILTDKTIDEVCGNLRKAINTFAYEYSGRESYIDTGVARHIDHILIRAYFYTKHNLGENGPKSWKSYLETWIDYDEIVKKGRDSLRAYLCAKYKFEYEPSDVTEKGIDSEELDALSEKIAHVKRYNLSETALARNDALQVLRVYKLREQMGDRLGSNPFGFKVWWLTQESRVKRATKDLFQAKRSGYIMRPELLLSIIDIIPSTDAVRKSFGKIFPTMLGIKLSNRMKEADFIGILSKYDEYRSKDPSRAAVALSYLSNQLIGDGKKDFENAFPEIFDQPP